MEWQSDNDEFEQAQFRGDAEEVAENDSLFPAKGERYCYELGKMRLDILHSLQESQYFVTVYDFKEHSMTAVRDTVPRLEAYPVALRLLDGFGDDAEDDGRQFRMQLEEESGTVNPDYLNALSIKHDRKFIEFCRVREQRVELSGIGGRVLQIATVDGLDVMSLSFPDLEYRPGGASID